ncbi:ROK family protein, partial [Patescibacteria group bacterium]
MYGAGKNGKVVVGVIWGSGIGGGIVIDGKIFSGANSAAGEFGHTVIDASLAEGRKCGCGQSGCWENLASGRAISEIYQASGGEIENAVPTEIYASEEEVAKRVILDALRYMGLGVAGVIGALNPDVIVFGGGVSKLPNGVYERIEKDVRRYSIEELTENLEIVRHQISDSAGVVGVAMLVFEEFKKKR